jgi:hypothetical protein
VIKRLFQKENSMSIRFIQSLVVILSLFATRVTAQTLVLPDNLIDLRSQQGEQFLLEAKAREAYFAISATFETQKNQAYCGVASIVMALNAIQAPAPETPEYEPYHIFTQDNLLDDRTETVLPRAILVRQGMTLALQLHILEGSESMGDHDSGSDDWWCVG